MPLSFGVGYYLLDGGDYFVDRLRRPRLALAALRRPRSPGDEIRYEGIDLAFREPLHGNLSVAFP